MKRRNMKVRYSQWKVDRELANHSLSSTASQGTSNIPFPWFLMLGCNSQAQDLQAHYLLLLFCFKFLIFPRQRNGFADAFVSHSLSLVLEFLFLFIIILF